MVTEVMEGGGRGGSEKGGLGVLSQPHCTDKNGENALLGGRKLFLNFVVGSLDDDAIFGDHIPQDLVKAA